MMSYLPMITIALIVIAIAKFIFNVNFKKLTGIILNFLVGYLILYVINLTGLIYIPLNLTTTLVVGIFGLPGVILLILLVYLGIF